MKYLLLISILFCSITEAKEFKIAVLYWSMSIEGQVAMRKGLEEELQKINAEAKKKKGNTVKLIPYVAGDGEAGIKNQVAQFHEVVSKNDIDLIIIQPTDNAVLSEPLRRNN